MYKKVKALNSSHTRSRLKRVRFGTTRSDRLGSANKVRHKPSIQGSPNTRIPYLPKQAIMIDCIEGFREVKRSLPETYS